jgi:hypothetical protein
MQRHHLLLVSAALCAALFTGCSTEAPPASASKEVKPAAPVGGQPALFEMYKVARAWSNDVMLLQLQNVEVPEVKPEPGKFGGWRATFVSPAKRQKKDFSYCVMESAAANLHKGVFPGAELPYLAGPQARPIAVASVKIDSPDALAAAKKNKDVAAYAEKHPDVPVQFLIEWGPQTPRPAWRVYWGTTISASDASAFIDIETGDFLKKSR